MMDDFNTANAITALQSMVKLINSSLRSKKDFNYYNQLYQAIVYMTDILGLKIVLRPINEETRSLYYAWQEARSDKDFAKADRLREILNERGVL